MRKETKEIIKVSAKEMLLSIFDLTLPFFEASNVYRVSTKRYRSSREFERSNYLDKIKYLKRKGMISSFVEGKETYLELTPKGLEKINVLNMNNLVISRQDKWDTKWRVVIFDIPEKHKVSRNILRLRLLKLGFEKIQESVYVYPFECTEIITNLSRLMSEEGNILIMISEIIQGENALIEKFLEKKILTKLDLNK